MYRERLSRYRGNGIVTIIRLMKLVFLHNNKNIITRMRADELGKRNMSSDFNFFHCTQTVYNWYHRMIAKWKIFFSFGGSPHPFDMYKYLQQQRFSIRLTCRNFNDNIKYYYYYTSPLASSLDGYNIWSCPIWV